MKRWLWIALISAIIVMGYYLSNNGSAHLNSGSDSIEHLTDMALADSAFPGGVLIAGNSKKVLIRVNFGFHTYAKSAVTQMDDIFDLASVSKVIGTTSAVMKLYEQGFFKLDDPVVMFLPEFCGPDSQQTELKKTVSIRHLLTHTSGLPPFRAFWKMGDSRESRLDSVYQTALDTIPGVRYEYSDIGMIIMGKITEKLSGMLEDQYLKLNIFDPLGMKNTMYNPPQSIWERVVLTEYSENEKKYVQGHVHDENAWSLGGVAGHAGLFSTADDLARFAMMMLNKGALDATIIFKPETVEYFTTRANILSENSRCLGWDSPEGWCSGGVYIGEHSFGHTGFTGTSIWIDPDNDLFVILLTNAVHPHREWKTPNYFDWRQKIHASIYEKLGYTKRNPETEWRPRWQH